MSAFVQFLLVLGAINLFTIGGGFVMLPLMQREFVDHYGWLTTREFIDAIAVGQLTPGPLTIMNAFIGYRLFGLGGAGGAVLATYLPSLIVVTLVSRFYLKWKTSNVVAGAMEGIRPAVIGLIAAVGVTLGRESITDIPSGLIALGSFGLIAFTKTDPTFVILGAGAAGFFIRG